MNSYMRGTGQLQDRTETGVRTVKRQVWTVKKQNRDNDSYRTGQDRNRCKDR